MEPIKKIAFVVNETKSGAADLAKCLREESDKLGVEHITSTAHKLPTDFLKGQDACCVIGGDGTFLSTTTEAVNHQVPVFGVNLGKLGFLATLPAHNVSPKFNEILSGKYIIKPRAVLKAISNKSQDSLALNDVVIKHANPSRLMAIVVYANDELITSYACDGILFATPTGSTAYNLSVGGPIIYPGANVFSMTPISPHTLTNRPVVFDQHTVMKVVCPEDHTHVQITLDGNPMENVEDLLPLQVRISERRLPLLLPEDYSHFRILRNKLHWGN